MDPPNRTCTQTWGTRAIRRLGVTKEFDCQRSTEVAHIVTGWQITASTTLEMSLMGFKQP